MMCHGLGWILLFVLIVVLIWATTGGPVRYDDGPSRRGSGVYRPDGIPHRVMPDGGIRNEWSGYTFYPPPPVKNGGIGNARRSGPPPSPPPPPDPPRNPRRPGC